MSAFEWADENNFMSEPADDYTIGGANQEPPEYCHCPGDGPWNVILTISGCYADGAGVTITHIDCDQTMDWLDPYEIDSKGLPATLSVVSHGTGPDADTWFELAARVES